jgi:hypothetical protein
LRIARARPCRVGVDAQLRNITVRIPLDHSRSRYRVTRGFYRIGVWIGVWIRGATGGVSDLDALDLIDPPIEVRLVVAGTAADYILLAVLGPDGVIAAATQQLVMLATTLNLGSLIASLVFSFSSFKLVFAFVTPCRVSTGTTVYPVIAESAMQTVIAPVAVEPVSASLTTEIV